MSDYTCKKGWILSHDETTDEYVPFFVKVRGKDIQYNINDLFDSATLTVLDGVEEYNPVETVGRIKYKNLDWNVIINSDNSVEINRHVSIGDYFAKNKNTKLNTILQLPIRYKRNDNLMISTSIITDSEELESVNTSVSLNSTGNTDEYVMSINCKVTSFIDDFPVDYKTLFKDSYICISLNGDLYLDDVNMV